MVTLVVGVEAVAIGWLRTRHYSGNVRWMKCELQMRTYQVKLGPSDKPACVRSAEVPL